MKKFTLTLFAAVALLFSSNVNAQMANGCIGPDFTATDINGTTWNLYDLLDQGKTVIMDISATWCGPCWSYHTAGHLEDVWTQYGPSGTNEMVVIWVEGDGSTNLDCIEDLPTCNSSSQGNWTTGVLYPIIDNASIASSYQIGYYPTIYMITPDRIVRENSQISAAAHHTQMIQKRILAIATADAGVDYGCGQNQSLASCTSVNMAFRLFNYSNVAMTSATITVTVDGIVQQTIPWTGNLATYENATVSVLNVTGTPGAKTAIITVTGVNGGADTRATNNVASIPFTIYSTIGGPAVSELFSAAAFPPANWSVLNGGSATTWVRATAGYNSVGSAKLNFYTITAGEIDAMMLPPIDFTNYDDASISFWRSHKMYAATGYNDKLMVKTSVNCGTTWSNAYSKIGATLASVSGYTGNVSWTPATAADWAFDHVSLNGVINNASVLIKLEGTSGYGNNIYLDDININLTTGVNNVADYVQFSVYPNPASEILTLSITLKQSEKATMEIVNTLGEVVSSQVSDLASGFSTVDLNVKDLPAGSYFVSVKTAEGKVVKPFMVQ